MLTWEQAVVLLQPLGLFVAGMVLYSVFTFNFYRFVAREDIFKFNFQQYNTFSHPRLKAFMAGVIYLVKYVLFFPILVSFWVIVLTILLALLSSEQTLAEIFFVATALVTSVRITAYYTDDLSKDLAKMVPFALLGVYLVNTTLFSAEHSWALLMDWPSLITIAPYYWLFTITIEFALRIHHGLRAEPGKSPSVEV